MMPLEANEGAAAPATGELTVQQATESFLRRLSSTPADRPRDESGRFAAQAPPQAAQKPQEAPALPSATEPAQDDDAAAVAALEAQETHVEAEAAIEPPSSWGADERAEWGKLPVDLQKSIATREKARSDGIQRRIQEAQEQARTESEQARQLRADYESRLGQVQSLLTQQIMAEFADIKSVEEVSKLAASDPLRFVRFQGQLAQLQAKQQEAAAVTQRQAEEQLKQFATFAETADKTFAEKHPEFADPTRGSALRTQVAQYLRDQGIDDAQMDALWNGRQTLSLRDPRAQSMVYKAMRFDAAKKAAENQRAAPKPAPQRPGVAPVKGAAAEANIRQLDEQATKLATPEAATALLVARRAARR